AGRGGGAGRRPPEVRVGARVDLPGLGGLAGGGGLAQPAVDGRHIDAGAALEAVVEEQVAVEVGDEVGGVVGQAEQHRLDGGQHAGVVGQVAGDVDVVADLVGQHRQGVVGH